MYKSIIVDADLCLKLSASDKFPFLELLLPQLSTEIYIHKVVLDEIKTSKSQINNLIAAKKVTILRDEDLQATEKVLYDATYLTLANIMLDKHNPNKNKGDVCSLAMAKTKSITYFATDEKELQPIIDAKLNTGINDIRCLRIIDIIELIKNGSLPGFTRKDAKNIWIISRKNKDDFDRYIWPIL